ncbi:hypothetical protein BGX23_000765 [Mortierella sp. AD031]|nr:hypothetical protein BGX23_000765 [Mortierella sp. AD031]
MEYFYSCMVYDPNANDPDDEQFAPQPTSPSTDLLDPISEHPLSQRNLVAEPSIVQFLAEHIQSSIAFKDQLLAIIELSKTDAQARQAAANAITILVKAKVRFNGANLRSIRVSGADLSGGQFDSAQLQGADLTGANLMRSWFRQADFRNTRMEDVQFGELPYLKERCAMNSCAYSPDGKTFAVGLDNRSIKIYNTTTWKMIHRLQGNADSVTSIAYSPCGRRLVSGGGTVFARRWDCETGSLTVALVAHSSGVDVVAYSPSDSQIATSVDNLSVRVWDPNTGALVSALQGHTKSFSDLAFFPDGPWLVSGSGNGIIRFTDARTGAPGLDLRTTLGEVRSIAMSRDGQWFAAGYWHGQVQLWDVTTGTPGIVLSARSDPVVGLSFAPDGNSIVTFCYDNTARLWDVRTGSLVSILAGHTRILTCVDFSPDGPQLATGSEDETRRLWELNVTGSSSDSQDHYGPPGLVYQIHLDVSKHVAFPPTSYQVASVSTASADEVTVWDADTDTLNHTLRGHADDISCLSFSPCGHWLASGSKDKTIRLWDAQSGTLDKVLEGHTGAVAALSFSPDGQRMVSCSSDETIRAWEMATSESRSSVSDSVVAVLDGRTGEELHTLSNDRSVFGMDYSSRGKWIATGYDYQVVLWKFEQVGESQEWMQLVTIERFIGVVVSVAWKPHVLELVTGCDDGSIRVWRIIEGLDGGVSAQLVWSVGYNHLDASNANVLDAVGLSSANRLLLRQCGAIDGSLSDEDDDEVDEQEEEYNRGI